jgi:hypothetical protein
MGVVGALGWRTVPTVDAHGSVSLGDLSLDWWVGARDRWHVPHDEVAVRARRAGVAPVYETVMRVPGGDVLQRVYGVAGPGHPVVVDVENASPEAVAVAFVLGLQNHGGTCSIEVDDALMYADEEVVLQLPRPPRQWATAAGGSVRETVVAGAASPPPFQAVSGRGIEAAVLYPLPHRTRVRVALFTADYEPLDLAQLPDEVAVARSWERQLDRGMRTELPDPLQTDIDRARADLLLAPPSGEAFVALENWGFDGEAEEMWRHLRFRERRAARQRRSERPLLGETRDALVREEDGCVNVLPGFRTEWLGVNVAVHDVPLRAGHLSYAVRWHGARPALLWEAPAGVELRAPRLDPGWSTRESAGETLLGEPPEDLRFDPAPESFS